MTSQLVLIESPTTPWRLDDTTRAIGRRGLAEARAALRAARQRAAALEATPAPSADATPVLATLAATGDTARTTARPAPDTARQAAREAARRAREAVRRADAA